LIVTTDTALISGVAQTMTRPVESAPASGSALLGQAAVVIWNDIAPEGRETFYRWHDKEHMPERLTLPGFRRGRRLRKAGHSPEWLTIYEAADVSALVSPEYLARLNAPTPATTDALRHFRNTSRAVCRVVHSAGSSTGGYVLALRMSVPTDKEEAMRRYLRDDAFPRAMAATGIVSCHLCEADQSASHVDTAESSTRQFDVPAWVVLCEASNAQAAEAAVETLDRREFARLSIDVRSDAAVYALETCRLSPSFPA
jgi:hypothetical protein